MRDGVYERAVIVFVWRWDHFLVLRRKKDCRWGIPGGKAEAGESSFDAVLRELLEETGIVVSAPTRQLHRLMTHRLDLGLEGLWECVSFALNLSTPSTVVTLNPEEHLNFAWVTPGRLLRCRKQKQPIFPGLIQVMCDAGYLYLPEGELGVKIQRIA
ncbi:MAG: NUDIX hydrolase [Candidatus Moraniibacteriota bacterium]|nr:MAG: NUDIX hydrolase [Candidatus Moranbacteria bacterium]